MLEIRKFDCYKAEEFVAWSPNVENYSSEGEIRVDNGYVKHGQYVCKTSKGGVYKLEEDLLDDILKGGLSYDSI